MQKFMPGRTRSRHSSRVSRTTGEIGIFFAVTRLGPNYCTWTGEWIAAMGRQSGVPGMGDRRHRGRAGHGADPGRSRIRTEPPEPARPGTGVRAIDHRSRRRRRTAPPTGLRPTAITTPSRPQTQSTPRCGPVTAARPTHTNIPAAQGRSVARPPDPCTVTVDVPGYTGTHVDAHWC
jgi:hypothetical protein